MGAPTLPNRANGSIITTEWFNVFQRALSTVFVPRDVSGFVGDLAASLGTTAYAWANAFVAAISFKSSLNFTTLKAPPTLPADFTLKLLAALGAGKGNLYVDETGQLLADAPNYALSGSSGTFSSSSTSDTAITNLSCTLTCKSSRPVLLRVVPDGSANYSTLIGFTTVGTPRGVITATLYKDGAAFASHQIQMGDYGNSPTAFNSGWPIGLQFIDAAPSAGSHTYDLRIKINNTGTVYYYYVKLFAMELFG